MHDAKSISRNSTLDFLFTNTYSATVQATVLWSTSERISFKLVIEDFEWCARNRQSSASTHYHSHQLWTLRVVLHGNCLSLLSKLVRWSVDTIFSALLWLKEKKEKKRKENIRKRLPFPRSGWKSLGWDLCRINDLFTLPNPFHAMTRLFRLYYS